jgi:hypothetical protein
VHHFLIHWCAVSVRQGSSRCPLWHNARIPHRRHSLGRLAGSWTVGEDADVETSPVGFVGSARKGAGQLGGSQSGPALEDVPDIRGRGF